MLRRGTGTAMLLRAVPCSPLVELPFPGSRIPSPSSLTDTNPARPPPPAGTTPCTALTAISQAVLKSPVPPRRRRSQARTAAAGPAANTGTGTVAIEVTPERRSSGAADRAWMPDITNTDRRLHRPPPLKLTGLVPAVSSASTPASHLASPTIVSPAWIKGTTDGGGGGSPSARRRWVHAVTAASHRATGTVAASPPRVRRRSKTTTTAGGPGAQCLKLPLTLVSKPQASRAKTGLRTDGAAEAAVGKATAPSARAGAGGEDWIDRLFPTTKSADGAVRNPRGAQAFISAAVELTRANKRPTCPPNTEPASDAPAAEARSNAELVRRLLAAQPRIERGAERSMFFHGRGYTGLAVDRPVCTLRSVRVPTEFTALHGDDHDCPRWLTASEFADVDAVAESKTTQLAELLRMSTKTVVCTGAGMRAAATAAARDGRRLSMTSAGGSRRARAAPTAAHHALVGLHRAGLVHSWVQQNTDGLAQKAGYPQEALNEVHGSRYNPANPAVKRSGTLKQEEERRLIEDAATADLVIVVDSSLSGQFTDDVAIDAANRSFAGAALGTVIINVQQTPQDGVATLRIFGSAADVLGTVAAKLGVRVNGAAGGQLPPALVPPPQPARRVLVPYDRNGLLSSTVRTWWDLRAGQEIELAPGDNCAGSGQKAWRRIGTPGAPGRGRVVTGGANCATHRRPSAIRLEIEGRACMLGWWWIEAAVRGALPTLPVVNVGAIEQAADRQPAPGAAPDADPRMAHHSTHWATRSL